MMIFSRPARRRGGLTLYEVFLALVLLAGALAVLGQHLSAGARSSETARLRTEAEMLATAQLNRVLGGAEPLEPVQESPIDGADPDWAWSLDVAAGPAEGLLAVRVAVSHAGVTGDPDEVFELHQWVRDPAVLLDAEAGVTQ